MDTDIEHFVEANGHYFFNCPSAIVSYIAVHRDGLHGVRGMGKLTAKKVGQYIVLAAAVIAAVATITKTVSSFQKGVIRYLCVPPEHISAMEFSDSVLSVFESLAKLDPSGKGKPKSTTPADSLGIALRGAMANKNNTLSAWVIYADSRASDSGLKVTLFFNAKDILDWKFIPSDNFMMDSASATQCKGSDKMEFTIKSLESTKPIGVAIVQNNASRGPDSVAFSSHAGTIIRFGENDPFWNDGVWYLIILAAGIALGTYGGKIFRRLIYELLDWGTKP